MSSSRLMLVLHSHIPYVKRQGRWPFGEVWLYEAMAETYIPLLRSFRHLKDEGISPKITLSFSPTLLEQLGSKYIKEQFIDYLNEREALAGKDERYYMSRGEKDLARLASYYAHFYRDIRRDFLIDLNQDIIGAVKQMLINGEAEIITTAATHAYLPLLDETSLKYQVLWGKKVYQKYFGREPEGFWLPECGYANGIEELLISYGFKYFFVDSHAIEGGKPIGVFSQGADEKEVEIETFAHTGLSTYRPYRIKDKDIVVFGRNSIVSHQVWSADYGYPGDTEYREFHRQSSKTGLKYWRVTDRSFSMDLKKAYQPEKAALKVEQHATHFVNSLETTGKEAQKIGFNSPIIVGCYDTELFGHWWWEGVAWLESVIKKAHHSEQLSLVLPGQVEEARHEAVIFDSSWGMGGKHFVWDNDETSWMWEIIKKASEELKNVELLTCYGGLGKRALSQALKELMLVESSDWLFMVTNNLTRDYAMKRFFEHYTKFLRICNSIRNNDLDREFEKWLKKVQYEDDFLNCL